VRSSAMYIRKQVVDRSVPPLASGSLREEGPLRS
jgi:hypothetical protein